MEDRVEFPEDALREDGVRENPVGGNFSNVLFLGVLAITVLGVVAALFWRFMAATEALTPGALLLIVVGFIPMALAASLAWRVAARFAQRLYDLPHLQDGSRLLEYLFMGRPIFPPKFSIVRQGAVDCKDCIQERFGGPGKMLVTSDSAVILQRNGRLTRLLHRPQIIELEHFEKVWDVLELRPRRWVYDVGAITRDGIPINYMADVRFQIDLSDDDAEAREDAIWKAAACTWIRDAWRTEPDRLMKWPKRVIISATEGAFRNILARYDLDDLLDESRRAQVRNELMEALNKALPGMGVRLLGLELGDLKLGDQVLKQRLDAWRAEKTHVMRKQIAEGVVARAQALEKAKAAVQKQVFEETLERLRQAREEGARIPAQLVLLSCIEVVKQADFNPNMMVPRDIISALNVAEAHLHARDARDDEKAA